MDDGNGVQFTEVYRGVLNEASVKDLVPGTLYSYKISATNFNGEGSQSSVA